MKCGFIGILKHFFNFSILVFFAVPFILPAIYIIYARILKNQNYFSIRKVQYFTTELFAEVSARKYLQE